MKHSAALLGLIGVLALTAVVVIFRARAATAKKVAAGKALFTGSVALSARMVGHDTDLPPETVRCSNCHGRGAPPPPAASASATSGVVPRDVYGSTLSEKALLESRPRRGGPPSRYDLPAFCRVLAQGIDPAHVIISQTMPHYRVSPERCEALWSYVTSE